MSEERKDRDLPRFGGGDEPKGNLASRARNRTVLLTPDAIGQVRASMGEEPIQDPMSELLPPVSWDPPAQAAPSAPAPKEEPFVNPPKGLTEEMPSRRSTGKFSSPVGPAAPRAQMAQTTVMPAPEGRGFSAPPKGQKGTTATNIRPQEAPQQVTGPRVSSPKSRVIGFLVSFDADTFGEVFEIRAGRWLVTSRPTDHGDFILIQDETISPLHAIIRATAEGKIQVLDQLSEYGTGLFKAGSTSEEEIAGTMATVNHGDTVRFGKRHFVVCMIPKGVERAAEE